MKSIVVSTLAGLSLCFGGLASAQHRANPPAHHQVGPVSVNHADLKQLRVLPGVGKKTAQRILDYRKQHGAFKSIHDLANVRGISQQRVQSWGRQAQL